MYKKIGAVLIFSLVVSTALGAQETPPNAMCPVMKGEKIKKKFHAPWNNREVYFCCRSCIKRFKKDPGKYAANLSAQPALR